MTELRSLCQVTLLGVKMSLAPCSLGVKGMCVCVRTCFILASSRRVCSSLRRSFLLPTRMIGTLGQKCLTSGVHFSGMFSATGSKGSDRCTQTPTHPAMGKRKVVPARETGGAKHTHSTSHRQRLRASDKVSGDVCVRSVTNVCL